MNKKILIITPRFPIPSAGACEQERLEGIKQLKRLYSDVRVIGKVFDFQSREDIQNFSREHQIPIDLISYKFIKNKSFFEKLFYYTKRILWPKYWDGSSFEYTDKDIKNKLNELLDSWKPDLVWFDYTYLWPLYKLVRKRGIPIITRSINFEAVHFLEEDGRSLKNYIQYIPKHITEYITLKLSDILFAITPKEEKIYKKMCKKCKVGTLPLRSMPSVFAGKEAIVKETDKLNVYFMGSTYNVSHNRKALEFVIQSIAPEMHKKFPGKYTFHIFGSKAPEDLKKIGGENVVFMGFVEDLGTSLQEMDIAIIPSLYGAGMQQKIFESLGRGYPTIASPRGLADYPFENEKHLLCASTKDEYCEALTKMQDFSLRQKLSKNAREKSVELFSKENMDKIILDAINSL
jgi:glycosyltransferase involved in cell wall biosynthesis